MMIGMSDTSEWGRVKVCWKSGMLCRQVSWPWCRNRLQRGRWHTLDCGIESRPRGLVGGGVHIGGEGLSK